MEPIAANPEVDPDYVDPEVEPLEEEAESKVLGSSGQSKVVGSSGRWYIGRSNMTYTQKAACLLMGKDAYKKHGFSHSAANAMGKKLKSEFGGTWHCYLLRGTSYNVSSYAKKYCACKNGSYTFDCIQT